MIIKKVVKSQTEPSTNCIWVKGNSLYQHINGKWTKFGQAQEDQLNDLQIDNSLHNEFFWACCGARSGGIVSLRTEDRRRWFPDIVMIIEPLDGTVILPKTTTTRALITPTDGIITKDMVRAAAKQMGIDLQPEERGEIKLCTYNCSAVRYWSWGPVDNTSVNLKPSTKTWCKNLPEPENKLALIEGITNWQVLKSATSFSWWLEEYALNTGEGTAEGLWWNEEKLTINSDFYMLNEYTAYDNEHRKYLYSNLFMCINALPDMQKDTIVEFNGTIYIGNLYMTWDMATGDSGGYWGSGLLGFFGNLKCYQYPTIDLTRYTHNMLDHHYNYDLWQGQYLYKFIIHTKRFNWVPKKPQKCIIKGFGNTTNMPADFWGIIDWDYDDMVASLITYSRGNYRCNISQTSFDKLTDDDLAAIVAMKSSVSVKA